MTDDRLIDALAKITCAIEGRTHGFTLDEVVAPGIERWMRHRHEAEILLRDIREAGYVFEKAHTPTDDEREDLMVTMMQDDLAHGRTGQTMCRYRENATAILAAGFHRSNPQRERSDALTLEQIKWDYQTLARNEQGKPAWQSGAEFDTCLAAHDAQVRSGSNRGVPSEALDLDALEALARAATPGPWMLDGMGEDEPEINYWAHRFIGTDLPQADGMHQIIATSEDGHGPNAEYIAAADPQTVLALITALRAAGGVR